MPSFKERLDAAYDFFRSDAYEGRIGWSKTDYKEAIKRVEDQMDQIIRSGGRVPMNDPLSTRLRNLRQEMRDAPQDSFDEKVDAILDAMQREEMKI